jgi:geranylgeranyl pyrophosphate synthase
MTRAEIRGLEAPDPLLEEQVKARLDQVEDALDKAVRSDSDFVTETASYLVRAGGKRFRPLLVVLAGQFGDGTDPRLVPGAVSIEITHLATLYHDDVIDEADFRRGIPSVNARWDNTVAILTGDYLFARASEISSELGSEVTKLLARTIATVSDGQIREVVSAGRVDQTEEVYMEVIRRKTASLIATSCRLGGMLSDAAPETIERLDDLGIAIGMAFQLSDDIMDVTATEEELKKPPGQDIREGVYTLPVLHALNDGQAGRELKEILSQGPPEDERLARALELVKSGDNIERSREAVTREVLIARRIADDLEPCSARDALLHIAEFLAVRCGASI